EKLYALDAVVDDVTGYERTKYDPPLKDVELKKTAIVRIRIEDASCKQRTGGPNGGEPPATIQEAGQPEGVWTGVVPCWTQYGKPVGHGNHADVLEKAMKGLSEQGEKYALDVAMAKTKVEGS
ncbi:16934_t:CDS:1, partial [Acaulospora colombiana]